MSFDEVPLPHSVGNDGAIVRVGDTVRRPAGPQTPAVAAFLGHLEAVGFAGAPRFLGYDERGREVLTYVEGDVATTAEPWVLTDEALVSVVTLVRSLHEAAHGFPPPADGVWVWPPPPEYQGPVMGHNDICRENVVFRAGRAHALIDFDWATPTTPAWEMANVVFHWVAGMPGDRVRRLALARDAWPVQGLRTASLRRCDHSMVLMRAKVDAGHPGFTSLWENGVYERNRELRAWVAEHVDD